MKQKKLLNFVSILVVFFSSVTFAQSSICGGEKFPLSQWDGPKGCYISNDRCNGDGIAHSAATNCDRLCNDSCAVEGNEVWASHTSACYDEAKYCVGDQYTANCSCYQVYGGS